MGQPIKRFLMLHVVPHAALALIRSVGASWRYTETRGQVLRRGLDDGRPLVGAFLHGRLFPLLHFMSRRGRGRWLAMCSKSLDGEAMSRVERAMGYEVVRGSSGSGGLEALVTMIRAVRKNPALCPCLAVDGSQGPRGVVQSGIVALAQRTGGRIMPVAVSGRPSFVFRRSWDRTSVPLPFARVHVVFGELIEVPPRLSPDETEDIRGQVQTTLHALQAEADALSGFSDP
jgi:lysophospholipid acyltransferase (LPLAT)-like uncharacterized protein